MQAPVTGNPSENCLGRLPIDLEEVERMNKNFVKLEVNPNNIQEFNVYVRVDDGLYRNKWFNFKFVIPNNWPNQEPWIRIQDKIWHPNIELLEDGKPETGRVCVSTLGKGYKAGITLYHIVETLKFLLVYPNPNDSLNPDAGNEQRSNRDAFISHVNEYLDEMNEYFDDD